ncbi:nicotinate-nucleotide adenylyltransferase [Dehalogenimonas sp. WBC-2]|nr:nicotinate-nucleotide adenylyltransferase [Dehalogenimonas sp. WBC-2]
MVKIGILGGTFDPPHTGHLLLAEEVQRQLNLDRVIFIPAGEPWVKASQRVSPAAERLEMVKLAVTGRTFFGVSDMEVRRPGPSYTWETLVELKERYPDDELYFILGWDILHALPLWQEPQRIIESACLVSAPRVGTPRPDIEALEAAVPGIGQRTIILTQPEIDISATAIRQRVALGQPVDHLVPPLVAAYISDKGLYKAKPIH